jgi:hypothetical protein
MTDYRLYEITERFKELESLGAHEELPPEVIADTLEAIDAEWQDKAVAVAAFIKNLEHTADGVDEAAKSMAKRAQGLRARAASLQAYLQFQMQVMNKTKIEHDLFTISVRKNPISVVVDDAAQIPEAYWYQPPTPEKVLDKKAIAAAFKAGTEVPGAHSFQGEHVRIEA